MSRRTRNHQTFEGLIASLRDMVTLEPPAGASEAALRQMLLQARLRRETGAAARPERVRRERATSRISATAAASLASLLLAFGGLTAVSQSAQPGSTLYPLKRFSERIAVGGAIGWKETADTDLSFASRRLDEVRYIVDAGTPARQETYLPGLVEDFDAKLEDALERAEGHTEKEADDIRARAGELHDRMNGLEPKERDPQAEEGEHDRIEDKSESRRKFEDNVAREDNKPRRSKDYEAASVKSSVGSKEDDEPSESRYADQKRSGQDEVGVKIASTDDRVRERESEHD